MCLGLVQHAAGMPVDFAGQRLAEQVFQVLIAVFSVVGFVAGYWQQCV